MNTDTIQHTRIDDLAPTRYTIGIDPGKSAGIGVCTEDGDVWAHDLPWALGDTLTGARQFIRSHGLGGVPALIAIEAQHVGINAQSALVTARRAGEIAQCCAIVWPSAVIIYVQPSEWRKLIGVANSKVEAVKWGRANIQGAMPKSEDAIESAGIARAALEIARAKGNEWL